MTFLAVLAVGSVVMAIWGFLRRTRDARTYRAAPPDLSGFSSTIDPRSPGEPS